MKLNKKYLFAGLGLLALGVGYTRFTAAPPPPPFRTATLEKGTITAAVNATGTITPISTVIVGSQISGQVIEVLADYNSIVEANQILARLDPTQVKARLDGLKADLMASQAQKKVQLATIEKIKADSGRIAALILDTSAQVRRAEATFQEAERTLARQSELNKSGAISIAAFETAKTNKATSEASKESTQAQALSAKAQENTLKADLDVAIASLDTLDAQILQRQAAVRQVEVDLSNTEIKSSVKGVVVQRSVELGMAVAASLQSPTLFLVAQDLKDMEILANIDEADVGRILPNQRVTFTVNAFPNRNFEGQVKLVRLGAQTVQNVVIYTTVIRIANPENLLKPGMTATLRIITDERQDVLRLPNAALRFRLVNAKEDKNEATPAPRSAGGQTGGGAGGGQTQELVKALREELKLDKAQNDVLNEQLKLLRDIATDPSLEREARIARLLVSRETMFNTLEQTLNPQQKETLATLKTRFSPRRNAATSLQPARIFVLNNEPIAKTIRIGISDGAFTQVEGNVNEGDKVIIGGGPKQEAAPEPTRTPRLF